ncbi:TPA: hypothetical protein N0F65_000753, partial [Lagenidium giganteum]
LAMAMAMERDDSAVRSGVTHVVVFSELSPRARVKYTKFLIENDIRFARRPSDGKFVANVRLEKPRAASQQGSKTSRTSENHDMYEGNQSEQDQQNDTTANVPSHLNRYASLIRLIGEKPPSSIGHTPSKEAKVVRLINDIYDTRHQDQAGSNAYVCKHGRDLGRQILLIHHSVDCVSYQQSNPVSEDLRYRSTDQFARFVRHYLVHRFGLKKLVDQQAWELIEELSHLRHRLDAEMFSAFLEGQYSDSALDFFLLTRAALQRHFAGPSFTNSTDRAHRVHQRKGSSGVAPVLAGPPKWLGRAQVLSIAQSVFGSRADPLYQTFSDNVNAFLAGQVAARSQSHLIEAQEFLCIAVETQLTRAISFQGLEVRSASPVERSPSPTRSHTSPDLFARPVAAPSPTESNSPQLTAAGRWPQHDGNAESLDQGDEDQDEEDVDARVGSLLARMQQRRQLRER